MALKRQNLLSLEQQSRIMLQVTHVDFSPDSFNVRVLFDQKPSTVGKEKSPLGVMWISIGVGELVMNTMITNPFQDVFLR
jgi:hypothetical protein